MVKLKISTVYGFFKVLKKLFIKGSWMSIKFEDIPFVVKSIYCTYG